jgi:uncharacterized protein YbjQ (UPF0145 family)
VNKTPNPDSILLTTEPSPDLPILERLGIVTAECVRGLNLLKDIGALFTDVVGKRSRAAEERLREMRETALGELRERAAELSADAVVAVRLDFGELTGGGKAMLVCVASGTAVKLVRGDR